MMTWVLLAVLSGAPDARVLRIDSPLQARVDAGGKIALPAGVFEGPLVIARDAVIVGAGRDKTIIDGRGRESVVVVMPGVQLTLEGVTLQNGASALVKRRPDELWVVQGTGGALRAIDRARVTVRHVAMRDCSAAADGSMLMLADGVVAELEDVEVGASRRPSGPDLYAERAAWVATQRAERVTVRGLRFLDASAAPAQELFLWVTSGATLSDVTLRERVGTGCAPRVWVDGKGARARPSARLERWVVPPSACAFAYVSPVIDVTYAGMEWPDVGQAGNVRRGE